MFRDLGCRVWGFGAYRFSVRRFVGFKLRVCIGMKHVEILEGSGATWIRRRSHTWLQLIV